MLATVRSCALFGLEGKIITVEVDVSAGLPAFTIVGLADTAVSEAKDRIKTAFRNSNLEFPRTKVTVNLAPADLKKTGSLFDLAIAAGLILAQREGIAKQEDALFIGELGLDGGVRSVAGVLPIALAAFQQGIATLFVPKGNIDEIDVVAGLSVYPVATLDELAKHLLGSDAIAVHHTTGQVAPFPEKENAIDFAQITGHDQAKRALEIAAAGGHHVLLWGPPGTGKTLLARAVTTILPPLSHAETLEVSCLYSVAGLLEPTCRVITTRPFRSPHHTTSPAAIVGGGSIPRPGEVSLAHRGILFLDEFPEFPRHTLECLRQPLEDGEAVITRAAGAMRFPSRFTLIAAQNPCPCGFAGDPEKQCSCSPSAVVQYQQRVSGPLLDRIDLAVCVPRVAYRALKAGGTGESSAAIRARVIVARERQRERFFGRSFETNAEMTIADVRTFCALDEQGSQIVEQAALKMHLSPRAITRILKVARTIADVEDSEEIARLHVLEAVQYRVAGNR